ncbi:MAG: M20/M25/M40 family metallo-hydrolase [Sandaracinaceae bacterium]|nr:M20/M25/M40 family metallo-hydrolase [Sandaracinaceae bacterium]
MNQIEMYSSSNDLKHGLHRALAVAHALTHLWGPGETQRWWSVLGDAERELAREHRLGLEALAEVYWRDEARGMLDDARVGLGLAPLSHDDIQYAFRAAIISGRAHRTHLGRDVYGASNKRLWDLVCADFGRAVIERYGRSLGEGPRSRSDVRAPSSVVDRLRELMRFNTSRAGGCHTRCVEWLERQLRALGFDVARLAASTAHPVLVARRPARGLTGHVVLYGHYDVTALGPTHRWTHPPEELTETEGRLFGRGVADDKGPLAVRIAALHDLTAAPALTWIIQGEEETGSPIAHAVLPDVMASLQAELWLDETGYHDHEDGTLRLLARTIGPDDTSAPVGREYEDLLRGLAGLASRWGVGARHEQRGLNKNVVEGGCPFNRNLPLGARYVALGVNDSRARIHAPDESIPTWTIELHRAELDVVFRWVDRVARESM